MIAWRTFAWAVGTVVIASIVADIVAGRAIDRRSRASQSMSSEKGFHQWLHENLKITHAQEERLAAIEMAFESERIRLHEEIEAAGIRLAEVIRIHPAKSPEAREALAQLAAKQGLLQEATLEHFFAMKNYLDEKQGERLLQWTCDSIVNGHHN
jgi:nickel and cobalt resistance protein CnrR